LKQSVGEVHDLVYPFLHVSGFTEKYAASQQTEPLPDVVGPSVRLSPNTMAAHFARRQHSSSQTRQEDEFMTSAAQFSRQLSREPIMRHEMNRSLDSSYMQRQERY